MRKNDILIAVVLMLAGLAALILVIPGQTGTGEEYDLPPAFMPTVAIAFGALMMFLILLSYILQPEKGRDAPSLMTGQNWGYIGLVGLILFLSFVAVMFLGYLIGSPLMVASFMIMIGVRKYLRIGLVSILAPLVIWFLLWKLLKMPLP